MAKHRAIDLAVNVDMGSLGKPRWLREAGALLGKGDDWYQDIAPDELLPVLDAHGIERAVLGIDALAPSDHVMGFVQKHPDRFFLSVTCDPRTVMKGVHALERLKGELGPQVVEARIVPFQLDLAPDTPLFYPFYAKCTELRLPIAIYTGLPIPPLPGDVGHPMLLDRVCVHFPDLVIVMAHGADPWWDVACRLMLKYRNLYLQTSAWAPKRLPDELIHFMNTRGQDKVLWASNHPTLPIPRCFEEFDGLPLREGVLDKFLYRNAARVFFGEEAT